MARKPFQVQRDRVTELTQVVAEVKRQREEAMERLRVSLTLRESQLRREADEDAPERQDS